MARKNIVRHDMGGNTNKGEETLVVWLLNRHKEGSQDNARLRDSLCMEDVVHVGLHFRQSASLFYIPRLKSCGKLPQLLGDLSRRELHG